MSQTSFFPSRSSRIVVLVLLFSIALTIRLYDLTDLPLDFHPTRQLLSAIKARALFFETQPDGYSTEKLETGIYLAQLKAGVEPVVFEQLVAFTYRFTGEQLWLARIYASLFWLIGGLFLFMLVRDLASFDGAILSTAYYLLFPYAVIASRSFQPDPLMVMLILSFWWMFSRWLHLTPSPSPTRRGGWVWAILAGLLGGLAIFVKFYAAFFVIGAALGLALSRFRLRDLVRNPQVWVMTLLGVLPASMYIVYGVFIKGGLGSQFDGRFIPSLLLNPFNYLQWLTKANLGAGGLFIMLGLLGFLFTNDKTLKSFMAGLWIAYISYGLFFDYHIATHDYYQLPFIPVVAVSLSPLGSWFFSHLTDAAVQRYHRGAVYFILLLGLFTVVWSVRNQLKEMDYRPDAAMWAEIGEVVRDKRVIGLMEDYGSRLEYWGWLNVSNWPYVGDLNYISLRGGKLSFEDLFANYSSKRDFFLVTDFDELDKQQALKARLSTYPIYAQGNGYIIYQIQQPK